MSLDPSRTTPHGLWRFAAEYCAAGIAVATVNAQHLSFPALQLFGQSIELSLKAFLLKRGTALAVLKSLSHSLSGLLAEARRRRLGLAVKLRRRELATVHLLSSSYSSHRFRYLVTGLLRVPTLVSVQAVALKLVTGLELLCTGTLRSTFHHTANPSLHPTAYGRLRRPPSAGELKR